MYRNGPLSKNYVPKWYVPKVLCTDYGSTPTSQIFSDFNVHHLLICVHSFIHSYSFNVQADITQLQTDRGKKGRQNYVAVSVFCRMQFVVCIALLLFYYNGQLLEHAICLVVLFFWITFLYCYCFLNEINGDGDGAHKYKMTRSSFIVRTLFDNM